MHGNIEEIASPSANAGENMLGRIKNLLAMATLKPDANPDWWLKWAQISFDTTNPEYLSANAHNLLLAAPYNQLTGHLHSARNRYPDVGPKIRYNRKLFMVARDGIVAANKGQADERHAELFSLCHALGQIADTLGQDPEQISQALQAVEHLSIAPIEQQKPTNNESVRSYFAGLSASLKALRTYGDLDADVYHAHRKTFRRAVHVTVLGAASNPSPELEKVAVDGIVLNRIYGAIKDSKYEAA